MLGSAEWIARELDAEEAAGRVDSEEPCRREAEPERFDVAPKALLWGKSPPLAALRTEARKPLQEITAPFQAVTAKYRRDIEVDFSRDLRGLAQHLHLGISDVIDSLTAAGLALSHSRAPRPKTMAFRRPDPR